MGKCSLKDLPDTTIANINTLIPKINELFDKYGKYVKCNSGYRTPADQAIINPKSPNSKHLIGAAIDLNDPDGRLNKWLKQSAALKDLDLYCEERQGGWQHIQIYPPKSGKRWFNP